MQPIIPREGWGAEPPWGAVAPLMEPHKGTVVHWEGASGSLVGSDPAAQLRNIQQKCKNTGYSDIFYNFAVSLDGRCWECRGWNKNSAANGTTDSNDWYYAICFLMGQDDELTQAAKNTCGEMLDYIGGEVWPHSHFFNTACPGEEARVWVALGYPHDVPLPLEGFLMALTDAQQQQMYDWMNTVQDLMLQLQKPGSLHTIDGRLVSLEADMEKVKAKLGVQ